MSLHWPLLRVLAVTVGTYGMILAVHDQLVYPVSFVGFSVFLCSLWGIGSVAYAHFVEYAFHRWVMHVKVPGLKFFERDHEKHHWDFHDQEFRSDDPQKLKNITKSKWALLAINYGIALLVLPHKHVTAVCTIFTAYLVFHEAVHWFTHVVDKKGGTNIVDRTLEPIPVLGKLWEYTKKLHEDHHNDVVKVFNFLFPHLWDWIFRTHSWFFRRRAARLTR